MSLKLCRICGNHDKLINILQHGPQMLDKLAKCANITVKSDDMLPKFICLHCDKTLELSYKLRKQSEAMQQLLQDEIQKESTANEVIDISEDEENANNALGIAQVDEENANNSLGIAQVVAETQAEVVNEALFSIHEISDSESSVSTLVASETEGAVDFDNMIQQHRVSNLNSRDSNEQVHGPPLRKIPDFALDIESNESSGLSLNHNQSNAVNEIIIDEDESDEIDVVDNESEIGDESMHSDCSSHLLEPKEYCQIDLMRNSESPEISVTDYDSKDIDYEPGSSATQIPYKCITCNESFAKKKEYQNHIREHGSSRYQCIQCLASFSTLYSLTRHEASLHTNGESHKCSECNRIFRLGYNLQRHILSCHSDKIKFQCKACNLNFTRRDSLKRHMIQVHTNKKWHCKACGTSFRSQHLFNVHKTKTCPNADQLQKAPEKDLQQIAEQSDEYISVSHDNKYKCFFCNMKFKSKANCRIHLQIHNDVRRFPCKWCSKSFRTRYAMESHERIHTDERPYVCDICHKGFRQITHVKNHRLIHNKDMQIKCPECQAGFVNKWRLREHLRKHYTVKAFKCAECPEEFCLKYDLKRHAKLVHFRSVSVADSDIEGVKDQFEVFSATSDTDRNVHEENNMNNTIDVDNDEDVSLHAPDTNIQNGIQNDHHVEMYENQFVMQNNNDYSNNENNFVNIVDDEDASAEVNEHFADFIEDTEKGESHHINGSGNEEDDEIYIVEDNKVIAEGRYNVIQNDENSAFNSEMYFIDSPDENTNSEPPTTNYNANLVDCIQLDSSNSRKTPLHSTNSISTTGTYLYENVIEEEEIHITEEKIQRFTSFL